MAPVPVTLFAAILATSMMLPLLATGATEGVSTEAGLPFDVSLRSTDPSQPLTMLGSTSWLGTDASNARRPDRDETRRRLDVAHFVVDGKRGPATLVVDLAAFGKDTGQGRARVEIAVECVNDPMKCPIPIAKTVMGFQAGAMRSIVRDGAQGKETFFYGRHSHGYQLPAGEAVSIRVNIEDWRDLEPVGLKAWVFYGENGNPDLALSSQKRDRISTATAGLGMSLLAIGIWWRRRRGNL